MNKTNLALRFLKNYRSVSQKYCQEYLKEKLMIAKKVGLLPAVSLDYFQKLVMGGKMIRGGLIELGFRLARPKVSSLEIEKVRRLSCFIEIFHTSILIHDDIMDKDNLRRGLKSGHKYFKDYALTSHLPQPTHFGVSQAITLADSGFYLGWDVLFNSNYPDALKVRIGQLFSDYIIRLAYGQMLDISNTIHAHNDPQEVLNIFTYKTAEYSGSLPLLIGFYLAQSSDQKQEELLKKYGLIFGWIFQIKDDILGIFGQERKLGKPLGSDISQAKNTILISYLLDKKKIKEIEKIKEYSRRKRLTLADLSQIRKIFKESGAYDYAHNLAKEYLAQGLELIPRITTDKHLRQLLESFLFLAFEREK